LKKLPKILQVLVAIAVVLAGVNAYFWFTKEEPLAYKDVVDKRLSEQSSLDPRRREQLRVQAALIDYREKNKGKLPESLDKLVPIYFERVPIDPDTGAAFAYRVEGNRYFLGSDGTGGKTRVAKGKQGDDTVETFTIDIEQLLMAALDDSVSDLEYVYDPTGKRDPFEPYDMTPRVENPDALTPLERYQIGQLRLAAVLQGFDQPRALIQDATGRGYTVSIGDKIGINSGEIIEILPDRVLILEQEIDFTGEIRSQTVEMHIRTPEQR
jgi:Tfp pilus assembly protein PilP